MATTGIFNGTLLVVKIGGVAVAHSTSCSLSVSTDLPDSTTKDSLGWAQQIQGLRSWSVSTDGLAGIESAAAGVNVEDLFYSVS